MEHFAIQNPFAPDECLSEGGGQGRKRFELVPVPGDQVDSPVLDVSQSAKAIQFGSKIQSG
jgi:hypothetical protein